jgi:hypothetical protein
MSARDSRPGGPRLREPRLLDLLHSARPAFWRFVFGAALPVATFYLLFRILGASAGIVGGMLVSLAVLGVQLRRLGRADPVVIVPLVVILAQGSVALLLDSVEWYLAAPALENLFWGVVLTSSAAIGKPLVGSIARELRLIPAAYAGSPAVARALRHVTLAWGLAALLKAGVRLWLLGLLELEAFLIAVTLFPMALNSCLLMLSFWWPLRAARRAPEAG